MNVNETTPRSGSRTWGRSVPPPRPSRRGCVSTVPAAGSSSWTRRPQTAGAFPPLRRDGRAHTVAEVTCDLPDRYKETHMSRPPFKHHGFVGQERALAPILRQLNGAMARSEPLPHLLLIGESGTGKSLVAKCLATEAKAETSSFYGLVRVTEIISKLRQARRGDFVFFDEAHRLQKDVDTQEMLYAVIDAVRDAVR